MLIQLAEKGFKSLAFDWLGFGFSEKPQPGYDFKYTGTFSFCSTSHVDSRTLSYMYGITEEAYHEELTNVLQSLNVEKPIYLVTQVKTRENFFKIQYETCIEYIYIKCAFRDTSWEAMP